MERSSELSFRDLEIESDLDLLVELIPKGFPELGGETLWLREWLRWKYSKDAKPYGTTVGFVSETQASIYGILIRNYKINQESLQVGLVVDVMTVPEMRGRGLFVQTAQSALDGLREKSVSFTIGFPIRKDVMPGHLRLAWKPAFPIHVYFAPIGKAGRKSLVSLSLRAIRQVLPRVSASSEGTICTSDLETFLLATQEFRDVSTELGTKVAQLEKSDEFLRWRLAQPEVDYQFVILRDSPKYAYAVCRITAFKRISWTVAVVDIDGSDPQSVRKVVQAIANLADNVGADVVMVGTNPSNAKRLGLARSGLVRTPLKFTTILRDVSASGLKFAEIPESQWRITWLDSDTL